MSGVYLFGNHCFLRLGQRQTHGEATSLARFAFHRNVSFQQLHRVGYDGKPQSEAVLRHGVAQTLEGSEDSCLLLFGHARACIFHRQRKYAVLIICT